uniref:C-type lectin domain-containing protein n=1 Tax=Lates calcarifer TaxID=8187 RepID=A0A4W6D583_LATCA
MKRRALRFLVLAGLLKVVLCDLFGENIYVPQKKTWSEARKHCRDHHTDLLSINNQEEDELLKAVEREPEDQAWIGLYKDTNDTWRWSGGKTASFFNWATQNNTSDDKRCVVQKSQGWDRLICDDRKLHFFCFQSSLVLVKEKKTWEEAMEHCRLHYRDLVSLPSESALTQTLQTSREAQTDHVWTGLRYLAGRWLWVSRNNTGEYQAWGHGETPRCSDRGRHCGALSLEGQHWESWDCVDKLSFVCY